MEKAIDPSCHRSHFGSRYTSGCCDLAGLLPIPGQFEPRCRTLGVQPIEPRDCERTQPLTQAVTVAILAQGTHWAVATAQAFWLAPALFGPSTGRPRPCDLR